MIQKPRLQIIVHLAWQNKKNFLKTSKSLKVKRAGASKEKNPI